jgi:hypothetical protein
LGQLILFGRDTIRKRYNEIRDTHKKGLLMTKSGTSQNAFYGEDRWEETG